MEILKFRRFLGLILVVFLGLSGMTFGSEPKLTRAMKKELKEAEKHLPEKYKQFLEDVEPIISQSEKVAFLQLKRDFEKEDFIEKFWSIRSIDENGFRAPFRETYYYRLETIRDAQAHPRFDPSRPWLAVLEGRAFDKTRDPVRIFLLNGPPDGVKKIECEDVTWPIQIWYYAYLPTLKVRDFILLFYRPLNANYELWLPQDGPNALISNPTKPFGSVGSLSCTEWRDVLAATNTTTAQLGGMTAMKTAADLTTAPTVELESAQRILQLSTDLDPGAPPLKLKFFDVRFRPGEHNENKTIAEISFLVPREQLVARELASSNFYNLSVIFRVVEKRSATDERRFPGESFKFDFSAMADLPAELPITIEEEVYPGSYLMLGKVLDANDPSGRQAHWEDQIQVPYVASNAPKPAVENSAIEPEREPGAKEEQCPAQEGIVPERTVDASATRKNQVVSAVTILPPDKMPVLGKTVFEARIAESVLPLVASVEFLINTRKDESGNRKVLQKHKPPYSVELDMGSVPRPQTVSAIAFDVQGKKLGQDEVGVNQGAHSFRVRMISPAGSKASGEVKIQAATFVPEGRSVKKMQFYLNDELIRTVSREPWAAVAKIKEDDFVSLRAVGVLDDGTIAEDVRYVNLRGIEASSEVNIVELYVVVKNGERPVENLRAQDFQVFEDGVPQLIEGFEYAKRSPITVGMVIDTSCSMDFGCFRKNLRGMEYDRKLERRSLNDVQKVAVGFLDSVLEAKDRGFTMDLNVSPSMLQPISGDKKKLELSLAGLRARGSGTAIYDALMRAIYEIQDIKGKKALVLLTDGEDNHSDYGFETALEYAKRAGVSVYTIGFWIDRPEIRAKLAEFAKVSGGKAYFAKSADELKGIYREIELELRSQYVLTYYSHSGTNNWRAVAVKMVPHDLKVRTIAGYYP